MKKLSVLVALSLFVQLHLTPGSISQPPLAVDNYKVHSIIAATAPALVGGMVGTWFGMDDSVTHYVTMASLEEKSNSGRSTHLIRNVAILSAAGLGAIGSRKAVEYVCNAENSGLPFFLMPVAWLYRLGSYWVEFSCGYVIAEQLVLNARSRIN